jgi:glycosyltransferase involved in cell wall biosynthesis
MAITPFPRKPLPVCEMVSPLKPFEAMAMRKCVVASNVAALAEIVEDGSTGILFQKGDQQALASALKTALQDPVLRKRLGENAREWVVQKRDWKQLSSKITELYDELLA